MFWWRWPWAAALDIVPCACIAWLPSVHISHAPPSVVLGVIAMGVKVHTLLVLLPQSRGDLTHMFVQVSDVGWAQVSGVHCVAAVS